MIEAHQVLSLVLAGASLLLAALLLALGVGSLRMPSRDTEDAERRSRRALLLRTLLVYFVTLRFLSLLLLPYLLDHLVPLTEGAMCAYGVTQATPSLSLALLVLRPTTLLVAACSLLAFLHATGGTAGPRTIGFAAGVALTGLVGGADAIAELLFAVAPRGAAVVSCCSTVLNAPQRLSGQLTVPFVGAPSGPLLLVAYATLAAIAAFLLVRLAGRLRRPAAQGGAALWVRALLAGGVALAVLPMALAVAAEVLAPIVLGLPHHHCPLEVWTTTLDGPWMLMLLLAGTCLPLAVPPLLFGRRTPPALASALARLLERCALALGGLTVMVLVHWSIA